MFTVVLFLSVGILKDFSPVSLLQHLDNGDYALNYVVWLIERIYIVGGESSGTFVGGPEAPRPRCFA